jgi:sugar/nucleoside kinase (ribokinase family)
VEIDLRPGQLVPNDTAAVLIDGHYPAIARVVAAEADAAGIPIVLDCGRWRAVYADLLPLATDIIMCATFRPPDMAALTAEETVAAIHERWHPELVAVTRGADDVVAIADQGSTAIPVLRVNAVDTMGAGDVLHGAYMYERYRTGLPATTALREAAALASQSCEHAGARRGVEQAAQTRLRG